VSFKVAIACEDHTLDQFVVRPVVSAMLAALGKSKARVQVITSPRLHGFDDLVRQVCDLVARWGAVSDLVIIAADTDCDDGELRPRNKPQSLHGALADCHSHSERAIAVFARQEIEVWSLWGVRVDLGAAWADVRTDCDPKERFFEPLLTEDDQRRPDRGRTRLTTRSLEAGWQSLKGGCPELAELEAEVRNRL
jgi:hypothetical protein